MLKKRCIITRFRQSCGDKMIAESRRGAAGILQQRRSLQQLQQQAKHKTIPSNKPNWLSTTAKSIGKSALRYHSPVGLGLTAGLDAVVPGLGFVARAVQQTFGDQRSHVLGVLSEVEVSTHKQRSIAYAADKDFHVVDKDDMYHVVGRKSGQVYASYRFKNMAKHHASDMNFLKNRQ